MKKVFQFVFFAGVLLTINYCDSNTKVFYADSPDSKISVELALSDKGEVSYNVTFMDEVVITTSKLDLKLSKVIAFSEPQNIRLA